ncbi:MAG: hypothetical protein CL908_25195 [Deltaproteobacteria bacterium]|nr:hypothetical protein [Deltaproteobacteria bacterium]
MTKLSRRLGFRSLRAALVLAVASCTFGCASGEIRLGDPFDRKLTLSEAQHRYTVLVRWSQFQKAKSFVAKDDRSAYLMQMKALEDARFTDYESEPIELDEKKEKATIHVTYTLYTPSVPYEVEVTEIQEWTRDGLGNNWHVHSTFDGLPQLAAN